MSVAFRRESDEEHLEPKFELPIPAGPNLVTPKGLALIEARVAELEAIESPNDEQKRDRRYWRQRLATARLAPSPAEGEVGFGSTVLFRMNGRERSVYIVGEDEADPSAGLIGLSSPLARALIGGTAGELRPFGDKDDAIEILSIR